MMKAKLSKLILFGTPLLFLANSATGGDLAGTETSAPTKSIFHSPAKTKAPEKVQQPDLDTLAVTATLDTENQFAAVLYDYQSQETLAHLDWDKSASAATIVFEQGDRKDSVELQVPGIAAMSPGERYSVLLQGLREAGFAWLSKYPTEKTQLAGSTTIQSAVTTAASGNKPIGYFDWVSPKEHYYDFLQPHSNITRYAAGWAYDPDKPSQSVWVHFYGKTTGPAYTYVGAVYANRSRPDVNRAKGITGNHGWYTVVPEAWDADGYKDTAGSCSGFTQLYYLVVECYTTFDAFAIDLTGDGHRRLVKAPYTIKSTSVTYR
ncbi:MAG: hypothetical protein P8179_21840 [Candidatus Thiodiazotropha sp.]